MGLGQDLQRFADRTGARVDDVLQKVALDLFAKVILNTPVDTGSARANWVATTGQPTEATVDRQDRNGDATIGRVANVVSEFQAGEAVHLFNNLPYIRRLEYGYSSQAPNGMVRRAVVEVEQELQAALDAI